MRATVLLVCGASMVVACKPTPAPDRGRTPVPVVPARELGPHPVHVENDGDQVVPSSYELELALDPARDDFTGIVSVALKVRAATSTVRLDALGIEVLESAVAQSDVVRVVTATLDGSAEQISVSVTPPLEPGYATLTIRFRARLWRDVGAFRPPRGVKGAREVIFTQFEPTEARRAFPCFDEPHHKVPWTIRLVIPSQIDAFSNAPEDRTEDLGDGHKRVSFKPTPPLPSYLVAFAVGQFRVTDLPGGPVPMRLIELPDQRERARDLESAPRQLQAIAKRLAVPVPYPKVDFVVIPAFAYGGMENAGLISLGEQSFDDTTVVHELTHLWFGDMVTPASWRDIWLAEGITEWLTNQIAPRRSPDDLVPGFTRYWNERHAQPPVRLDAVTAAHPREFWRDWDRPSRVSAMHRATHVLDMMTEWLGRERMDAALSSYLSHHAHSVAGAEDFVWHVAAATRVEAAPVLFSFLELPGIPEVEASIACDGPEPELRLAQRPYHTAGSNDPADALWTIPVCFSYDQGQGCVLLDRPASRFRLDARRCPRWFHANADGAGYYLQRVRRRDLRRLVRVARELDAMDVHELVRTIIAMVESGALGVDEALDQLVDLAAVGRQSTIFAVVHAVRVVLGAAAPTAFHALEAGVRQRIAYYDSIATSLPPVGCDWLAPLCDAIRAYHATRSR